MIKAVIFDLDGTLMDDKESERRAVLNWVSKYISITDLSVDFIMGLWHEKSKEYWEEYRLGRMTMIEQKSYRVQSFFEELGKELSLNQAYEIYLEYGKKYPQNYVLYDDVLDCLEKLDEYVLGIVTNGTYGVQNDKIQRLNLKSFFSSIIISEDVGVAKPNTKIFDMSLKELGVNSHEAVFVGDRIDKDIEGAQNAGIKGLWIDRGKPEGTSEYKDIESIDSLYRLLEIVRGGSVSTIS